MQLFGFNPTKCKTQCRLGVGRIKLLRNKKQLAASRSARARVWLAAQFWAGAVQCIEASCCLSNDPSGKHLPSSAAPRTTGGLCYMHRSAADEGPQEGGG